MTPQRPALHATLLTIVAGIADAVGYLTMGGVFAANMTGNTVLSGIALARRDYPGAWDHIAPLFCFFAGAMFARSLLRLTHHPRICLAVEAGVLAIVEFLPLGVDGKLAIVAVAMGIQASAITHFAGSAVSTVVVTSTLARAADYTLDRLWPGEKRAVIPAVTNIHLLALTWIGYLAGAVAGTLLLPIQPWLMLVPAAILIVSMAV
ncbi:MAG: DUF1275 domain-containing protein [Alphaproteobacteria bacterium]|nr:DUF1275 domain-containing protein [Alphaproteobacteria bacterium]